MRQLICVPGATGLHNGITDVRGVTVGHATLTHDGARTGVTAIVPPDVFYRRPAAGGCVLNGAGEVTGFHQILEWGLLETPIVLTSTMSVGACYQGCVEWMREACPEVARNESVVIPVVGECDDSFLSDAAALPVQPAHVRKALESATGGPVVQGCVGAGTGMISFGFKAGIGTASRVVEPYTLGVLVLSNFGRWWQLRLLGSPIGEQVREHLGDLPETESGSCIVVVATDAPLLPHQLARLARRASLGLGRLGACAGHGSGEIMLAFSTGSTTPRAEERLRTVTCLSDFHLDPFFEACVQATEEAVLNALYQATDTVGLHGRRVPRLPFEQVIEGNSKSVQGS